MPSEHLYLWDETIRIDSTESLLLGEHEFDLHIVKASDNTHALIIVSTFVLDSDVDDLHAFLDIAFMRSGLQASFIKMDAGIFLESISPIDDFLKKRFADKSHESHGVIILINGREPGNGNSSLKEMKPKKGDNVQVLYRVA